MTARPAALRDAGIAAREAHADPRLMLAVDAKIAELAALGEPFSADTLRPLVPAAAIPLVGGRLRAAIMRRPVELVCVGEVRSTHGPTHAKKIGLYVGAEHAEQVAS